MKNKLLSILMAIAMLVAMLPTIPVFASQVWDGSSKSEPSQDNGIYQISNGAELSWFADYINGLVAADTGLVKVDAVLTDDIDLGGNEWTPISLATYVVDAYAGTFDGQNHSVANLKINATKANYGLFSIVNTGTIKNLKVDGNITSNNVVGGIVGKLQTGTIENCSFSGSVTTTGTSTKGYVGGIAGTVAAANATIKGCANTANVKGVYAGGMVGYNKNKGVITSCYNTGDIIGTSRSAGIAGQQSTGEISYCYNIGSSTNGICGFSNATITNCYYLNDESSAPGGSATGYEKITEKDILLDKLNAGSDKMFSADNNNMNNGYPVLGWQLASSVLCVPIKTVTISGNAVTGEVLTAQALGENDEGATNVSYQWSVSDDNINFNDIADATASSFTIPDIADFAGKYIKVTVIGEEESTANAIVGAVEKSEALINAENADKVQTVIDNLTLDNTVIKESTTINLPTQQDDCTIEWSSSNEDIIASNGVVTLPDKNIATVTLAAKVICGNASKSKSFNIDVWAKDIDADVYLQKALDSMQWSFSQLQPVFEKDTNIIVKLNNVLHSKGFDGITVTVKSTSDTSLISNNGKITYPELVKTSFADGKQVKVFFNLTVEDKTVTYPTSDIYALNVPWDTSSVRAELEANADTLLADVDLSYITNDLDLPSCFNGDKYSFAWITWTSSDEQHIKISNENRESGADSLYNAYVGKVYPDSQERNLTLTATVENPSTGISTIRNFNIKIPAMSDERLNQSIDMMNKILECYTADKLSDSATKNPIDISAVDNDIQLIIPSKVVSADELSQIGYGEYWDYWNYRFSVTSSDTDVIEINSFRAYVYRPLGEDSSADKTVTLTVNIESKENPNLFATKDITVTVKHLTREEINNALGLMDDAKAGYEQSILGNNSDTYSIIDNLTPFKEIVRNELDDTLDYIYSVSQMKGNGIIVDELPGWEEQEDWRLFKTSNKDLLSNETLILNYTPNEDTFVKINSVLTDETFGKYYTKFQNDDNYDVETLAKFKQLYKQPVSAYVMVLGDGSYNEELAVMTFSQKNALFSSSLFSFKQETDKPISVTFTLLGLDGKTLISKTTENSFTSGSTVYQVFRKLISDNNMYYASRGSYVYSINGLAERDYGGSSGWMYTVDKVFVNSYMNAQELYGGEDIVVMYVRDYKQANKLNVPDDNQGNNSDINNNDNTSNGNSANNGNGTNNGNSTNNSNGANNSLSDKTDGNSTGNNTVKNPEKTDTEKGEDTVDTDESKIDNDTADTDNDTASDIGNTDSESQNSNSSDNNSGKKNIVPIVAGSALGLAVLSAIIIFVVKRKKDNNN